MNQYSAASLVVPIAPSPLVVAAAATSPATAGQKRKLNSSNSIHATAVAAAAGIPRRESAPATLAPQHPPPPPAATPVALKPSEYWKFALEEWSIPILDTVGIEQEGLDNDVGFLETTADRVEAYQNIKLLKAVRRRDLATLRAIDAEHRSTGSTMNACNRFGESILHLACRKGSLDVVELLLEECGCSLLVRDDYGRTVLHDACWTVQPPWKLIKLILKKAPVLWRVSDVRGHLALQYVPKSAWPQWSAFLSKNRDLLQRIMVHSYHQIDIMKLEQPRPQQPVRQEESSTNDAGAIPRQTLPQQQPQQQQQVAAPQQPHTPLVTIAEQKSAQSHDYGPTNAAKTRGISICTGGASAAQAHDVLARALAQANPAMVQAIQQEQPQGPRQQGLSRYSPSSRAAPQAPGPATAALDEALRAQSAMRSNTRPNRLMTEQRDEAGPLQQPQEPSAKAPTNNGSQDPLPYAPSISMINERLAGYQKSAMTNNDIVGTTGRSNTIKPSNQEAPLESLNPLPAVPNPLLATGSAVAVREASQEPQKEQQQQEGVPTSITTRKNVSNNPSVPNPMAPSASSDDSSSSVSMSASPSVMEGSVSDTTTHGTTDTDSDRAGLPSSTPSSSFNNNVEPSYSGENRKPQPDKDSGQGGDKDEGGSDKDGSKKRVVG